MRFQGTSFVAGKTKRKITSSNLVDEGREIFFWNFECTNDDKYAYRFKSFCCGSCYRLMLLKYAKTPKMKSSFPMPPTLILHILFAKKWEIFHRAFDVDGEQTFTPNVKKQMLRPLGTRTSAELLRSVEISKLRRVFSLSQTAKISRQRKIGDNREKSKIESLPAWGRQ